MVVIENLANVSVVLPRTIGQWAALKFVAAIVVTAIAGCFTPGTWIQIQAAFWEPGLLVATDPRLTTSPSQRLKLTHLPLFCVIASSPHYVDTAMPCNGKGAHSTYLM